MTVTNITNVPGSASRFRIYIDEEFAFVLYKGELVKYDIANGSLLSNETYQEIIGKVLPKRAKMRSLNILKNRSYTEKQMRDKLKQGEYSEEIISLTIEYLKSYNYIDDTQFARSYVNFHLNTKSRNRIRHDLLKKGIPFEVTDVIYLESAGEDESVETDQILKWIEKKKFDKKTANSNEKQRIFSLLQRKGFTIESIKRFL